MNKTDDDNELLKKALIKLPFAAQCIIAKSPILTPFLEGKFLFDSSVIIVNDILV